jgi:hypothetical protein
LQRFNIEREPDHILKRARSFLAQSEAIPIPALNALPAPGVAALLDKQGASIRFDLMFDLVSNIASSFPRGNREFFFFADYVS